MFRITTLIENTKMDDNLSCEHGLSLHISDGEHSILFDTGASTKFIANARKLGLDMGDIDALVLSHGHFDHTGGVKSLLGPFAVPKAAYIGRGFFDPRYSLQEDGLMAYIGAALVEGNFYGGGIPLYVLTAPIHQLFERVYIIGGFSREIAFETPDPTLLRYQNGSYDIDGFEDEIALVLERDSDLIVISGCAHTGSANICSAAENRLGKPVHAYIGGTHLMSCTEERIAATAAYFKEKRIKTIAACHCTGEQAGAYLAENLEGYEVNYTGKSFEF